MAILAPLLEAAIRAAIRAGAPKNTVVAVAATTANTLARCTLNISNTSGASLARGTVPGDTQSTSAGSESTARTKAVEINDFPIPGDEQEEEPSAAQPSVVQATHPVEFPIGGTVESTSPLLDVNTSTSEPAFAVKTEDMITTDVLTCAEIASTMEAIPPTTQEPGYTREVTITNYQMPVEMNACPIPALGEEEQPSTAQPHAVHATFPVEYSLGMTVESNFPPLDVNTSSSEPASAVKTEGMNTTDVLTCVETASTKEAIPPTTQEPGHTPEVTITNYQMPVKMNACFIPALGEEEQPSTAQPHAVHATFPAEYSLGMTVESNFPSLDVNSIQEQSDIAKASDERLDEPSNFELWLKTRQRLEKILNQPDDTEQTRQRLEMIFNQPNLVTDTEQPNTKTVDQVKTTQRSRNELYTKSSPTTWEDEKEALVESIWGNDKLVETKSSTKWNNHEWRQWRQRKKGRTNWRQ